MADNNIKGSLLSSEAYERQIAGTWPITTYVLVTFTPFNFTFTSAGLSSRTGPTLEQLKTAYNTTTNPWVADTSKFNMTTQGIQLWTVPATGNYIIDCYGASGGKDGYYNVAGGLGARIRGQFSLTAGQILAIVVGQQGDADKGQSWGGGGGGGSFVWINGSTAQPMIAAGGGGSGGTGTNNSGGQTGTSGGAGGNSGGAGGTGGNTSASSGICGGGGGQGWFGGATYACGGAFTWPALYTNPTGGNPHNNNIYASGGFGGGAGAWGGGGGGGGYSGGGSSGWNYSGFGGGGGSYNAGINQLATGGINSGAGQIIITAVA